ncbi:MULTISPECIES: flagellar FlbD family protein [unclassified Sporolactobacillus]|uniref:flagellar FlbD family protein n=1 Tax=unclassified Sporolactobacillus TaxID=2628533 RepID=UPI00236762DF|nr:flagellar FlbD family protein [Sporolactobacillus sp. CQH2019]MDD9147058.1 flagellar FlbD family protein [Sporolactobacillus sp. CQH2019]
MIQLTRFNGQTFLLNVFLIEQVEALPDTTITLTTGKKLVVRETADQVDQRITRFLKQISWMPAARAEESVMRCLKTE